MKPEAPVLLGPDHRVDAFDCGVASLDDWLKRRARANQMSGASRTYVSATRDGGVAGYYAIASGALAATEAPGAVRRNMPDPIPMAVIGRFAVDRHWQGSGLGAALLRDAVERIGQAAAIIGIRGILVHALDQNAAGFYERHGFQVDVRQPLLLVMSIRR